MGSPFSSSLIGAYSDEHGRRGILLLGIATCALNPLTLLWMMQVQTNMSPWWYYIISALQGLVSWSTVALSSLTDAIPQAHYRAPSFGLAMAGLALGFAMGPLLAAASFLTRVGVAMVSVVVVCVALVFAMFYLPETLTRPAAARAKRMRQQQHADANSNNNRKWLWYLYRPLWALSILNRNHLFRVLALLAFLSGIVSSGDKSLILYYIQEHLGFVDADIAKLFLLVGILGIVAQALLLKLLNDAIGERGVVLLGFTLGTIHNALYGLAETKRTIYVAASIATIVSLVHPTLSAILSNNVQECEYGRIQGALASLQSLAAAFGPMTLRCVYHFTKENDLLFGPGSMFIFASMLYATAACCSYFLPPVSSCLYIVMLYSTIKTRRWNAQTFRFESHSTFVLLLVFFRVPHHCRLYFSIARAVQGKLEPPSKSTTTTTSSSTRRRPEFCYCWSTVDII
jgi:MFS transporter, DHA1 family, tetracycline resistance protein